MQAESLGMGVKRMMAYGRREAQAESKDGTSVTAINGVTPILDIFTHKNVSVDRFSLQIVASCMLAHVMDLVRSSGM